MTITEEINLLIEQLNTSIDSKDTKNILKLLSSFNNRMLLTNFNYSEILMYGIKNNEINLVRSIWEKNRSFFDNSNNVDDSNNFIDFLLKIIDLENNETKNYLLSPIVLKKIAKSHKTYSELIGKNGYLLIKHLLNAVEYETNSLNQGLRTALDDLTSLVPTEDNEKQKILYSFIEIYEKWGDKIKNKVIQSCLVNSLFSNLEITQYIIDNILSRDELSDIVYKNLYLLEKMKIDQLLFLEKNNISLLNNNYEILLINLKKDCPESNFLMNYVVKYAPNR